MVDSFSKQTVSILTRWKCSQIYNNSKEIMLQINKFQFGNHENSRMASRLGSNCADGLNMITMFLSEIAITYGNEIGMKDGYVSYEDTQDTTTLTKGNKDNYLKYSR